MLETLATFAIALVLGAALIGVLAYLYAKSNYDTGKSETETDALKKGAEARAKAEEEHEKALREGREKYLD